MKLLVKFTVALMSLSLLIAGVSAQKYEKKTIKKPKPAAAKPKPKPQPPDDMNYKILLEGSDSKVETPFVFVARDSETYALMRSLVEGLPASSTIDFSKNAVIGAFAGMRNTGGWTVSVSKSGMQTVINLNAPPKGGMSAQVITTPFQIALVPLGSMDSVSLVLSQHWTQALSRYRLTKGDFEFSGGIAGRVTKFKGEGTIDVLSDGTHHTHFFDLRGKNGDAARRLFDVASGITNGGQLQISRIEPGSFADAPHPPVKMFGTMSNEKLVLTFESLPPTASDGFMLRGNLEAVKAK